MLKKSMFFMFLFVLIYSANAQTNNENRVEIGVSGFGDDYYLIPIGEKGIILYGESEKQSRGSLFYDFSLYNNNFQKVWTKEVVFEKKMYMLKHYFDVQHNKIYVLMANKQNDFIFGGFQVLQFDVDAQEARFLKGNFPSRILLKDFYVNNGIAYLGGAIFPPYSDYFLKTLYSLSLLYVPTLWGSMDFKLKPFLYQADFNTNTVKPFPFQKGGNAMVTSISVDTLKQETHVFLTQKLNKNNIQFKMFTFDADGKNSEVVPLNIDNKYDITSGKLLSISNDEKIIIGTFNIRPKRYKESYANMPQAMSATSTGIFYAKISDGKQEFIKTYPFSKFSNFYAYLSHRAKGKMNKRIAKKEAKGKDYNPQYNILFQDLQKNKDELIMVAEAFYPEYETHCHTDFNPNGTTSQRCYSVFIGYRFTHAIVGGFDTDGNMLWDNTLQMMDVLSYDLKPKVKYLIENDEILLLYSFGGEIKSTVVSGKTVIEPKSAADIGTGRHDDKVNRNYNSGIEYWYDNYFIAYGYQRIKTKTPGTNSKRKVFYFSKMAYE